MNRARPGWKANAVIAGGWAALGGLSISIGNGWLGAAQLALAAATAAYAFIAFRKARQAAPETHDTQSDATDERSEQ